MQNRKVIHIKQKSNLLVVLLLFISILVSIDFFSYIYRPELNSMRYILFIIYIAIIVTTKRRYTNDTLDKIVIWTVISLFLSIIPAVIDYSQGVFLTFKACVSFGFSWFIYFALKRLNIKWQSVIKVITIISIIWVLLELIQQFTYPHFLFSGRFTIHGYVEERMGIWRYYIYGVDFVMIAFAYWLGNIDYSKSNKMKALVLASLFLIGLLAYGSRKHVVVVLGVLALFGLLSYKGSLTKRILIIITVGVLLSFLYVYYFAEWMDLNEEMSQAQGSGEDFVRLLSAKYYLFDFSDSQLYPIFGAGLRTDGSLLDKKLDYSENFYGYMSGFWQSDVGIIGYYSMFGLLGVSAIIIFVFYFIYNWKYIDSWLKYFFIMKAILIFFDFWAIWVPGMMAFTMFMYMLDCNIRENKKSILQFQPKIKI